MQRFIFQGAHFFSFIFVLSLIIFLSGCGGGGSSWDTSYNNGISPSSNKTPQAVLDKAKQENASKGGRAESSPIVLQAGTTATILAYSADAGTTSSFGIYQPEEKTLTGDTNHAIGQTRTVGPFSEDKNLAFWFQSGVSPPDSKIQLTPSGEGVYYVGCEDLTDNDYNDFVAQVTVKSISKLSIKNVLVSPAVFKPYDEITTITADIEATDFTPTNLYWEIKITDNDGNTIKTLAGGTSASIRAIWDGLRDDGNYACGDADNIFKLNDQGQIIRPEYTGITYKGSYNIEISASCTESYTTSYTTVSVDHRPLEVFSYNQDDSRWGNTNYDHFAVGDADHTIGKVGCALTSVAMLIAYHNRLFDGLIVNPLNLNNALIQNNGYKTTEGEDKGSIIWKTIPSCCKQIGLVTNVKYKSFPDYDPNIVKSELENGHPCIVNIKLPDPAKPTGIHFVLVKGTMGKDKHILNDPGFKKYYEDSTNIGVKNLYLEDYLQNSSETKIDGVALFEPITGIWPFKSLGISCSEDSGGNVEYALIDPLGRYIGYSPTRNKITGSKSNVLIKTNIPDAQYFSKPWTSIDNTSELIGGAKNLWVYKPIEGVYILKVFGTNASSHYWLDIGSDHPDEVSVLVNGFVTPGQVIEYSINFSQTAGTIPVVNKFIIGSLELEPATLNLNSNGNNITAHISLPTGYNVQDIDIASLRLENSIPALSHPAATCDHSKLMVKFDRRALIDYIKSKGISSGEVTLTVTGSAGSNFFRASDTIRIK